MNKGYFITGIGTSVGKTVVSTLLALYWKTSYWKPIQSGDLALTDSQLLSMLTKQAINILPEVYSLHAAESPHYAAELENRELDIHQIKLPSIDQPILVEGAGGIYVPINETVLMIDLMKQLKLPVVLVCRDYLGCINHSLLSIQAIIQAGLTLSYLVFNGSFKDSSARIIKQQLPIDCKIIEIPDLDAIDEHAVRKALTQIRIY